METSVWFSFAAVEITDQYVSPMLVLVVYANLAIQSRYRIFPRILLGSTNAEEIMMFVLTAVGR